MSDSRDTKRADYLNGAGAATRQRTAERLAAANRYPVVLSADERKLVRDGLTMVMRQQAKHAGRQRTGRAAQNAREARALLLRIQELDQP